MTAAESAPAVSPDIDKTVFIVEDSLIVSLELEEMLRKNRYHIAGKATRGEDAVERSLEAMPDVILMDINLDGDLNGIDAAKIIKGKADIPIIFTTAYSDEETLRGVMESQSDSYVLKPYNYKELCTQIDLAVRKNRLVKEARASDLKYRILFEKSHDAIFLMDTSACFIDVNTAFLNMFGFSREEIIGTSLGKLFPEKGQFSSLVGRITAAENVSNFEAALRKKDSGELICLTSASSVDPDLFKFSGFQGIIRDVTARRRYERELEESMERLEKAISGIIRVLALSQEARDPYTAGHQKRVSLIAGSIAREMGLDPETIKGIVIASEIHDIGKISVPAEILSKPGKLTDNEFGIIKEHPIVGYDILRDIDFPWPLADSVRQHHERIDGSGYPDGLKADEIIIEAKIIMAADVIEAMASFRPYRPPLGLEKALEEINGKQGVHYDREVVRACNAIEKDELRKYLLY